MSLVISRRFEYSYCLHLQSDYVDGYIFTDVWKGCSVFIFREKLDHADEDATILQIVGKLTTNDTVSHPTRLDPFVICCVNRIRIQGRGISVILTRKKHEPAWRLAQSSCDNLTARSSSSFCWQQSACSVTDYKP